MEYLLSVELGYNQKNEYETVKAAVNKTSYYTLLGSKEKQ